MIRTNPYTAFPKACCMAEKRMIRYAQPYIYGLFDNFHRPVTGRKTGPRTMKKITLSLLATSIISTTAFQAVAATPAAGGKEPGLYFYPSKSWALGAAAQSAGCAVQNEFNNGFVLQFDGSNKGVQSFTTNFRQNLFHEGQQYQVTLSVPGKLSKTISATATGPSLLTVPLTNNADLYKNARDNAVIDLSVEQNNFRFYLVNFAPAAANFEKCMAGGSVPASAPAPTDTQRNANAAPVAATPLAEGTRAAVLNEAIAMEEKEAAGGNVAITEIIPENPQAEISDITADEAGGNNNAPMKAAAAPQPIKTAEAAPVALAAQPEAPRGKRMSEMLAEEIANNPSIVADKDGAAIIINEKTAASENPAAPAFVNERPQSTNQPDGQPVAIAPTIEERGAAQSAGLQQKQDEAAKEIIVADTASPAELKMPSAAKNTAAPEPVQKEALAPEPTNPGLRSEDKPESKPQIQPDVKSLRTPAPVVHKQNAKMEADFTRVNEVEPAGQPEGVYEPFSQFEGERVASAAHPPARAPATQRYTADPEMLMKISELEKQVQSLRSENAALNDELKTTVSGAKEENQSIASENWNLERATMRFTEAERQVKRMGDQVQRERAKCEADKKDLEAQLFDPQITGQQQLARLADLEQKLAAAEQKLADQQMQHSERMKIMQSQTETQ